MSKVRETVVPPIFPPSPGHDLGERREHGRATTGARRGLSSLDGQNKKTNARRKFYDLFGQRLAAVNRRMGIHHSMNICQCFSAFTGEVDHDTQRQLRFESVEIQAKYDAETGNVSVHQAKVGYCHSPAVCPVCGRIIRAKRFEEVHKVIAAMTNAGYKMGMLTLTASHNYYTSLVDFRQRMTSARNDMFAHNNFKTLCAMIGKAGHIVATEVTLDNIHNEYIICGERKPSGWHYHLHYIFFYTTEDEKILNIFVDGGNITVPDQRRKSGQRVKHLRGIKQLWLDALGKNGLGGRYDVAADYMAMPSDNARQNIATAARYLIKDMDDFRAQRAKKAAFELAGISKKRKFARMKIQDLQYICAFGREKLDKKTYDYYCEKWKEYVKAIDGDRWLVFSDGLKAFCGLKDKTDAEVMQGENGDCTLLDYTTYNGESSYTAIVRQGGQGYLLNTIEDYINGNQDMVDFIRLCHQNKDNKDFQAVPPASYTLIQDFAAQCVDLAAYGYDVEPCKYDDAGNEVHILLHRDLRNKTCRCSDDKTLPDIVAGKYMREAENTIFDAMTPKKEVDLRQQDADASLRKAQELHSACPWPPQIIPASSSACAASDAA